MSNDAIEVEYNQDLQELETLLSDLPQPGNFYAYGAKEIPMPKVEVDRVGIVSFPISVDQIKKIIEQATQAPYGRGAETILDTSVRKTWQLPPEQVHISGKSWSSHFKAIIADVKKQLGCHEVSVEAELYKLLVYDTGSFFLPHRDSEKSAGMFGTLVVVLPSPHKGGELIIRHAGKEQILDLSNTESSELTFGAFYADCEHEVRPVTQGYRVCLVYNLIQKQAKDTSSDLTAPNYDQIISEVADIFTKSFTQDNSPAKIAWLLEHQYSQAELSFSTLKNADAAIGKVLSEAALKANCAIYLGIVHIEESGSAEPDYDHYSRRSRWRYDEDDCHPSDNFEVVEVCDSEQYIDGWMNLKNQQVNFGALPLVGGELLPEGALEDEDPDEQRLLEATGNAGVSFERAYHRAAFVIWKTDHYIKVLLQSGVAAALVYFKERVENELNASITREWRHEMTLLAQSIIDAWESSPSRRYYRKGSNEPNSSEMILLLCRLKEGLLIEHFIEKIVIDNYDGTENAALVTAIQLLDNAKMSALFNLLVSKNMQFHPHHCVHLLSTLLKLSSEKNDLLKDTIHSMASEVVNGLVVMGKNVPSDDFRSRRSAIEAKEKALDVVTGLWNVLIHVDADHLLELMVSHIMEAKDVFDPCTTLPYAISTIHKNHKINTDPQFLRLWEYSATFLLEKSEHLPEPPKDWRQDVNLNCKCLDCIELKKFALDPQARVYRFRVPQDRRSHLINIMRDRRLDMTHETDEKGRPYTLVCTKTRATYNMLCSEHLNDIKGMQILTAVLDPISIKKEPRFSDLQLRLTGATQR
jgi:predicted 2-oxoglutarate/Fe(II)-dependent dioxygenase YbiX